MTSIENRLSKLEEQAVGAGSYQTKQERDAAFDAAMIQARSIAAVCNTWQDLAAYLRSLMPTEDQDVVSLERRRQIDAVTNGTARRLFDEVSGKRSPHSAA